MSKIFKYIAGLILIATLVVVAQYFITNNTYIEIVDEVNYFDVPGADYRVHYIENEYYNSEYMESGQTYLASLVDYIDIDFDYHIGYSKVINATSAYDIKATIIATDPKTKNVIWNDYKKVLLPKKEVKYDDKKDAFIKESIRINYNEFNDFLKDYSNKNHINVDAYLSVVLSVKNKGKYEHLENINSDNSIEIKIPLNEVNFKIDKTIEAKKNNFVYKENNEDVRIRNLIIGGILWIVIIVLASILALSYRSYVINEGEYNRKLKKILATYDGIIVNVDKLPSLDKMNVAHVSEFEELVDAQNEVRLPINFKENKRKGIAKFVLIRNDLAWVYTLKEGKKSEK